MATKRKITINRKPKATVEEVKIEVEKVEPETEQEVEPEVNVEEVMEEVKEEVKKIQQRDVMGTIWGTEITKPKWRIVFEAQMWAYPMYRLPEEIRKYLVKKGLTTEVYKKSKEWLEKHHVDLEMVQKLKDFLTRRD